MKANLKVFPTDISIKHTYDTKDGQVFSLVTPKKTYLELILPFLGRHQLINAALAVASAEAANIEEDAIRNGLKKAVWPGRLEIVNDQPLIVMDCAHNCHSMEVLKEAVKLYWPHKRKIALLTMLADKEREKALNIILPLLDQVVITKPPLDRAGDWQYLDKIVRRSGKPYSVVEDIGEAYLKALSLTGKDDLLLISGSLFLISEVGKIIKKIY